MTKLRNGLTFAVMALLIVLATVFYLRTQQPEKTKCRYEDGNYYVQEPDDIERAIMLPHTELGFTAQTVRVMEDGNLRLGEPVVKEGKTGRPLAAYDVSNDYKKNVKIIEFHQVENGDYCVLKVNPDDINKDPPWSDPTWTVWSEELLNEVKIAQGME